jgi:hypothetical protein
MITIDIPKQITFDLPEGNYAASLERLKVFPKQTGKGIEEWVRLGFDVAVPSMPHLDTKAGRSFKFNLNPGSELRNFLIGLLGPEFFLNLSGQPFDLETLLGTTCEVRLEHFQGKAYDKPMVVVAGAFKQNSLKLTGVKAKGTQD